ncbi:MAG TPA: hypothetical protein VN132_13740 [Bdellovibrio sp.]|nr:hypothetical protein [Bdellovibrio sp.]
MKNVVRALLATVVVTGFVACGGGGGGSAGGGGQVLYYPYQTVYGDLCKTYEATPGCTFSSSTGQRIKVTSDPDYNKYGYGSDDLWYVKFDKNGQGSVYDDTGAFQYYADVSKFAGYVNGTTIGVGTTGFFWENVANGMYWLGKNGVLYSANSGETNYGQAVNNQGADEASDANFAALNSEANQKLVKLAADKLVKDYGFKADKATAVASALNSWAVAAAERGATTGKDMDKTFTAVFGVQFSDALTAVKDLVDNQNAAKMQDVTNRSAAALGLKPYQAQQFMKGMYKKALASWGYDDSAFNW